MRKGVALVGAFLLQWAVVACGASALPSPSPTPASTVERAQTPAPATAAASRPPSPAPTRSTASPAHAEVILRWDAGAIIADVDDVSDMVAHLKNTPGIVDGFGDETQITILYDPQLITPEKIQRTLADMGFPTRKP